MRIAVAQMKTRAGDFGATTERMLAYARSAVEQGAGLVVYPYAALTGTTGVDYPDRVGYVMDLVDALDRLAQDAPCPLLVTVGADYNPFGTPAALLLSNGDTRLVMGEGSGTGRRRGFELEGTSFDVAYTYDELDDALFAERGAQVVLFVSSLGFAADDPASAMGVALEEGTLRRDVAEGGAWLVGAASLGCYDGEVFTGSSFVLAPWGQISAQAPAFEEELMMADVDPSSEGPLDEPLTPEVYDRLLTLWQALALGLSDTLEDEGAHDVALALDGRLASSALCMLALDALGPTHVHALLVPSGSDELDRAARDLSAALRIDARPLDPALARGAGGLAAGELAACALASLARGVGAVPLSDADKTALALEVDPAGVSCGGLAPFGDVYRSDVIELARLRNTISPVIAQASLTAFCVPDVGPLDADLAALAPEVRLELVDAALSGRVDWERGDQQVELGVGRPQLARAVLDAFAERELGRLGMPRVIRASARTIGEARRPLGSAWRDRGRGLAELEAFVERLYARLGLGEGEGEDGGVSQGQGGAEAPVANEADDMLKLLRDMAEQGTLVSPDASGQGRHGRPSSGFPWGNPFSEN